MESTLKIYYKNKKEGEIIIVVLKLVSRSNDFSVLILSSLFLINLEPIFVDRISVV
uniref:Uncharacterized protein n=1 Tax=Lepeophtheirus salmonis TaxID=72036 RepID=A0A0K2SY63_LEPSM